MADIVSVYVNVHDNGTLSISVDIPLDLIQKVQLKKSDADTEKELEGLVKNWVGKEIQPETERM